MTILSKFKIIAGASIALLATVAIVWSVANLWQADMIVMGNSARSVLLKKVVGDTLLETLRYTQIPLVLAQ
jgi:nucleotide-binding universal stress UspA family protein